MKRVSRILLFSIVFIQINQLFADPSEFFGAGVAEERFTEPSRPATKSEDMRPPEGYVHEQQTRASQMYQKAPVRPVNPDYNPSSKSEFSSTTEVPVGGVADDADVHIDPQAHEDEMKRQASEAKSAQEDLLDAVNENIAKRVDSKKFIKWGEKEKKQIKQLVDQYGQEFAQAADLSEGQVYELQRILTEGLMRNASTFSHLAEMQGSLFTSGAAVARSAGTRLARAWSNEEGRAVYEGPLWDPVDKGRFDFRTTDKRFKDALDLMTKEPFTNLSRLFDRNMSFNKGVSTDTLEMQKQKFIDYAKTKLMPDGKFDRVQNLLQKSHYIPEGMLATALFAIVVTIVVEVKKK